MKKDMEQSETRDVITNNNQKLQITHSQKHKKKKTNSTKEVVIHQDIKQQSNQIYSNANQPYIYQQNPNNLVKINNNIMMQQNGVIVNQLGPVKAKPLSSIEFKINRKILVCPYCNNTIATEVEKEFNYCTCIIRCLECLMIPLAIFAICVTCDCSSCSCDCGCCCNCCGDKVEEEEIVENPEIPDQECCNSCKDATHTCPVCKKKLADYISNPCRRFFDKLFGPNDSNDINDRNSQSES